jgi:hypothetical protein
MTNVISELAEEYMNEVTAYTDRQMEYFLRKNLIPFDNIEQSRKWLKDRGLRIYDEVEGESMGDKKHTLLLLRVIDEAKFVIKAPSIKIEA